jgi:6-phosphogluconolactonase
VHVYVCAYQDKPVGPGGIYQFDFDSDTGSLTLISSFTEGIERASFLAINKSKTIIALADERAEGVVQTFRRDPVTGALANITSQLTLGADPCFVSFDSDETHLLLTNYTGGSFVVLPVDSAGNLGEPDLFRHSGSGPNPDRQEGPHPHMVAPHPIDGQIYVTDLGKDEVEIYDLDPESGRLSADIVEQTIVLPSGAGPRHFAFNGTGDRIYVNGELDSTVSLFERDHGNGEWNLIQTVSTLPPGTSVEVRAGNTTAQILLSPDGRFVYCSNRGHDSIAIFAADPTNGRLTALGHESTRGNTPRNFNLDPSGTWLLAGNQDSDTIATFRRDPATGQLTQIGDLLPIAMPICILFV